MNPAVVLIQSRNNNSPGLAAQWSVYPDRPGNIFLHQVPVDKQYPGGYNLNPITD
jgi:hypothetical protein